jgi:hypothetical protein
MRYVLISVSNSPKQRRASGFFDGFPVHNRGRPAVPRDRPSSRAETVQGRVQRRRTKQTSRSEGSRTTAQALRAGLVRPGPTRVAGSRPGCGSDRCTRRGPQDDRTKPHCRDQNRFRRMAFRQTERIRPGGLSDRPQEQTQRRFSRGGIRARGAHGLATGGSAVEGAGSDGRSTGTGQDRQVESVTVGSVKNRAVLSALFARSYSGGKGHCWPGCGVGPESPGPSRSGERLWEVLSGSPQVRSVPEWSLPRSTPTQDRNPGAVPCSVRRRCGPSGLRINEDAK